MIHQDHPPGAPAQQEAARPLRQPVDEVLLQVPHGLLGGGGDHIGLGAAEDRVHFHKVAAAKGFLGGGADDQPPPDAIEGPALHHPSDQAIELRLSDPLEIGHLAQVGPSRPREHPVLRQSHGQELMHQHRPAAIGHRHRLDKARPRQLDQGGRLEHGVAICAEEGGVGGLPGAAAGAAHALEEGAHRGRGLSLKHLVQIADVDAQLQRAGADDARVATAVELGLGQLALLLGDGAVVHIHRGAAGLHAIGHQLGHRPALAEHQALVVLGHLAGVAGHLVEALSVDHQQLSPRRLLGRIDDHPWPL